MRASEDVASLMTEIVKRIYEEELQNIWFSEQDVLTYSLSQSDSGVMEEFTDYVTLWSAISTYATTLHLLDEGVYFVYNSSAGGNDVCY